MSRFPKLTETFILFEMLAVEKAGTPIEVYPLLRAKETKTKIEANFKMTKSPFNSSPCTSLANPGCCMQIQASIRWNKITNIHSTAPNLSINLE